MVDGPRLLAAGLPALRGFAWACTVAVPLPSACLVAAPSLTAQAPDAALILQKNHLSGLQRKMLKLSFWNQEQLQQASLQARQQC
jgi:hypothetical protein